LVIGGSLWRRPRVRCATGTAVGRRPALCRPRSLSVCAPRR